MDNIKDLKSRAYDLIALVEQAQAELRQINQQIAVLSQQQPASAPADTPEHEKS